MIVAPIPSHESARLDALHRLHLHNTGSEPAFDELAQLAAYVCRTPIAVISLVDASRQWFKAVIGLPFTESPRSIAFCAHTILGKDLFIVEEADTDTRFHDHPWVIEPPAVRFYAGVPLLTDDGHAIGSLAVMDVVPRSLTPEQRAAMQTLARQVMAQCELREPLEFRSTQVCDGPPPEAFSSGGAVRRRAEEERTTQEMLLTLMLNTGPGCIKRVAADGTLLYMNPAGLNLIEACSEQEAVGRPVFDLILPEHRTAFMRMHQDVIGGAPRTLQFEMRGLQGTRCWLETHAVPFRHPVTGCTEHLAITYDISQRKQADEALRISRERLHQALRASSTGLWDWNTVTGDVSFSREWKQQLGYEETELPDSFETWVSRLHPEDRDRAISYAQRYCDNPVGAFRQDFRLRHKDGSYRWIDSHASFVTEADGRRIRLLGSHTDITERKQVEQARAQAMHDLRTILETVPDVIYALDRQGRLNRWNEQMAKVTGYAPEELHLKLALEMVPLEEAQRTAAAIQRAFETGYAELEGHLLTKDGRTIPYHWTGAPFTDLQGRVIGITGAGRDITARKKTDQLLSAEKRILELIGSDASLPDILTEVCRMIEGVSPEVCCSVLLLDEEGAHLRHGAAPSLPESYIRVIDGMAIGPSCGSCGTAAFTGQPVIVDDIASHPFWDDFRDLALPHGLRACWSIPILAAGGRVLGTFAVYCRTAGCVLNELPIVDRASHLVRLAIERKQTEQALRLTRFSIQHAVDAVFWIDAQARILDVNDAACTILGYTREELLLKTVHDIDPNFPPEAWPAHWEDLKARKSFSFETDHRKKDGAIIRTETTVNYLIHEGREFNCAFMRDITDRKQAEAQLHLTQFAIERAGDMAFWVAPSSRLLLVNAVACERLGYSKEELLGMAVSDIDPNYRQEDWARHWEDLRQAGRLRFETQHQSRSGEVYPVEVVANYVVFDGKEYNFATVRDVSDRMRAEGLLKFSEERFRLVAEATNDILWDWDLVTHDHWWSPNAQEKFGYDPGAEPSITAWTDRLHPDDRDRVMALVDRALASDAGTAAAEYRFRLADGSYGYFYDRGQIIRDQTGRAVRMIGAMIDVTFSKRAYASLEAAYQQLQGMSRELQTVEANERRRLSRELHDEVGQLLTALKFDLAAARQALADKHPSAIERAQERAARALETTDELFARLRRIVRALRPPVLEELGLREALEAMVSDIQSHSDLVCAVSIEGEVVDSVGAGPVETALYRIAQELATNVARHAQAMTLTVILDTDGRHWMLTVQDDGIGFNPKAESISGMGVRGVRERAEILGGRVDVSSMPGAGTTVTVWIPVRPLDGTGESPHAL